jgi:flagellar biosynthesis anti-sigma factor FlgM
MAIKTISTPLAGYETERLNQADLETTETARARRAVFPEADRVSLSQEGRRQAAILTAANEASGIRDDKVAAIKSQIQAGTYAPKPRDIAAAMIQHDLDLWA